jgi:predicted neuraminidase
MHTWSAAALALAAASAAWSEPLTPAAFQDRVEAAGGRVDFIFEEDRPHPQCHASCVEQAADGSLVAVWFGGTKEKDPDVAIWQSRFTEGAWAPVTRAAKVNGTAHWNPVVFQDPGGALYHFFKVGPEISHWQTYWARSEDHGQTWSEPVELVPGDQGGRGPVRSKPVVLADGAWLAPSSTELGAWLAFVDRSEDRGRTWTRSADFAGDGSREMQRGVIQPALWESAPGKVHALLRSRMGMILRVDSEDGGRTWGTMRPSGMPNNNSGVDVAKLPDGRLLLAYNPVGTNWGARSPLTLALSSDNGETWQPLAHVEQEDGKEFSYPSLALTRDGVALSYTWKRERIRCWQIPRTVLEPTTAPE